MQFVPAATFSCPHCAVLYEVSVMRHLEPQSDAARCTCCARVMAEWCSDAVPSFRLVRERALYMDVRLNRTTPMVATTAATNAASNVNGQNSIPTPA